MKKTCLLFFLALACCAYRPAAPSQPGLPLALEQRADRYTKDGRYLEALSFYRDIAMNPAWADRAGPALYKNMAAIYREYLGDGREADLWSARYRAAAPGSTAPRERDQNLLSIAQPLPGHIRVLIADISGPCHLASDRPLQIMAGENTRFAAELTCRADGNNIIIDHAKPIPAPLTISPEKGATIRLGEKICRSSLVLNAQQGHLFAVSTVPLEDYLRGVLPREMAPSWPLEALKAQAVAARTYALYHSLLRRAAAYDVLATTSSQVYDGSGKTYASVNRALDETRGQVLAGQGRLALTLFHANSGGMTEPLDAIWGGKLAYLCGVADPYSTGSPGAAWNKTLSVEELSSALARFGVAAGAVQTLMPVKRSASGRIEKLKITTGQGAFFLSGNSFRLIVGPGKVKGTNFQVRRDGENFMFTGAGSGHGAGMSQWGACTMAKKGFAYTAILGHYYPGTRIVQAARHMMLPDYPAFGGTGHTGQ